MDFTTILEFLKTGDPERVGWLVFAFIVFCILAGIFVFYVLDLLIGLLKKMFPLFTINRKEKIVKVPEYITPPENKEIDKYLTILKKIADDYRNSVKL